MNSSVRLGFELTDIGSIRERAQLASWAEDHGFDDVWTAEITDPDAFVILAAVALATERIRLGTAIIPLGVRTAPHLAAAAASIADLAPDRFALGVGVSSKVIVEDWNGVAYDRPLERARESIEVLRAVLRGERTDYAGAQITSKGFKLRRCPSVAPSVVLAALGPKMLALAGELADGVYLNFVPTEAMPMILDHVRSGMAQSGRTELPEIALGVPCAVTDDAEAARQEFAHALAFYMTAPPYQRALESYGFEEEVAQARVAWQDRDLEGVRASISRRLLDGIGAFGDAAYCRERIEQFIAAGVTAVAISPTQQDVKASLLPFAR